MKDLTSFERIRKRGLDTILLEGTVDINRIADSIYNTAATDPVHIVKLISLVQIIDRIKKTTLLESAKIPNAYIMMLSALEVGIDASITEVENQIRRLSWKHSIMTYIKTLLELRRRAKNSGDNDDFINSFYADLQNNLDDSNASTPKEKKKHK
ncbi:hypothetical protein IHQ68_11785 [Chelatococcus sambhunathii]|uniref:Uncharacterized protein n=1 Tax=Chelatococcus sambhunathii TaxID=363953 RepID=A0ABU1DGT4_9HYPH|nr:hypothetical protein [Chelatococcus sambhunathii]MDR4307297.1 hypothetical protein [Chelatococcus sambhunathii]